MLAEALSIAALAAATSAQQMNLTATLASLPQLSNLTSYISGFPALVQQLSSAQNVTLLAPNNAAFAKALNGSSFNVTDTAMVEGLFLYHVLNGTYYASAITGNASFLPTALTSTTDQKLLNPAVVEAVTIGDQATFFSGLLTESTVTSPNHNFTGGTIHIIDTLLTLPQNIGVTAIALNETSAAGALAKANIANGPLPSNITAFIPNNAAFQAISNLVANLTTPDLVSILGYHLVPNITAYSTDLTMNTTLPTLDPSSNLTITVLGSNIFVNGAKVITPDILVQEGVLHIIDAVLNPANATAKPAPSTTVGNPAFEGATSDTAAPFTSGIPRPSSVPAAATGGVAGQASSASSADGAASTGSSSSGGAAMPMVTGAVGAAALFGGVVGVLNL